jgi:F-type H+-transporting ATPase subunit a
MASGHEDTFHHVRDFPYFETSETIGIGMEFTNKYGDRVFGFPLPEIFGFQLTKFMVLQVVAGLLVLVIFRGLSSRLKSGEPAKGRWWNFWEMLALFIRDEVVRPTIGDGHHGDDHGHGHDDAATHAADDETEPMRGAVAMPHATLGSHPADKYLPFNWTSFFFVLFCNLLGAVPWLGSATAEINVTGAMAIVAFGAVLMYGTIEMGPAGFWKNLVPGMDLPGPLKIVLVPMIWVIEFGGLLIKHGVLAVRLFANIMAGHTVIAVILGFITMAHGGLYWLVLPSSIFGQVAIGKLELFVAFLQAYVFAFLATLFIGAAIHEH